MKESRQRHLTEVIRVPSSSSWSSMQDVMKTGRVYEQQLKNYVEGYCETIRIGKTDVVIASQGHIFPSSHMNSALKALAAASGTKAIVMEYFLPELRANARKLPVIGKVLEKKIDRGDRNLEYKIGTSQQIAEIAKEAGKPVAVADIANKPGYMAAYAGMLPALIEMSMLDHRLLPFVSIYAGMWGINRFQEVMSKKGHFDPEELHKYEKILFDTEDARRLFVADGIKKLAAQYESQDGQPSRILVIYPAAHAIRIANYLTDNSLSARMSRAAKEKLYSLIPGVEISLRQYRWGEQSSHISEEEASASESEISHNITPHPVKKVRRRKRITDFSGWVKISESQI